jgi:hypothetical protein
MPRSYFDEMDNMLDRVKEKRGSLLDNIQYALGAYAKGPSGPSIVPDDVKALMKYHGVSGMEPTEDPSVYTFMRGGKKVRVALPRAY